MRLSAQRTSQPISARFSLPGCARAEWSRFFLAAVDTARLLTVQSYIRIQRWNVVLKCISVKSKQRKHQGCSLRRWMRETPLWLWIKELLVSAFWIKVDVFFFLRISAVTQTLVSEHRSTCFLHTAKWVYFHQVKTDFAVFSVGLWVATVVPRFVWLIAGHSPGGRLPACLPRVHICRQDASPSQGQMFMAAGPQL